MPLCYAPFPLPPGLVQRLRDAGIETLTQQAPVQEAPGDSSISLWIYDSPDRLLSHWQQQADPPVLHQLLEGLQTLLAQPPGAAMISVWRLEQLDPASIRSWLGGLPAPASHPGAIGSEPPPIDPLVAQLALTLLQERPVLLENYLDLELKSELVGTSPDSLYLDRLQASVAGDSLLADWWGLQRTVAEHKVLEAEHLRLKVECVDLTSQLQDMRWRAEELQGQSDLLVLQLRQVQQELEQVFLRSRESEQQLEEQGQALRTLTEENEAEKARCQLLADERNQLVSRLQACQSQDKEESELLRLQLQQVQEELERYFRVSREQGQLIDRMDQQLQRALRLLAQASPPQPVPVTQPMPTGAR